MRPEIEVRYFMPPKIELRKSASGGGPGTIAGYAIVYDQLSEELGGRSYSFREKIAPGAFASSVGQDDQLAYWNHNSDIVMGRRSADTLRFTDDEHGLGFELDLPDTQAGRDAAVLIERRDVRHMSFGFQMLTQQIVEEDRGDQVAIIRTVLTGRLLEVSPVGRPAYPQTDVAMRSIDEWRAARSAEMAAAAGAVDGQPVTEASIAEAAQRALLRRQQLLELGYVGD